MDGSSSLGIARFLQTLSLAKDVLSPYNISRENTNVAAAVYAYNTTIHFNLTQYFSYAAVSSAIDLIPYLDQLPANLSLAMETVNRTIISSSRENVTVVIVVFVTTALSGNCPVCQTLRDQGVKIITVGIGEDVVDSQLVSIATNPAEDFVVVFPFLHIPTMSGVVSGAIAQGKRFI